MNLKMLTVFTLLKIILLVQFGEKETAGWPHFSLQLPKQEREVLSSSPWYSAIGHVGMVQRCAWEGSNLTLGNISY